MKTIPLTRGYVTVVDDADFLEVGDLKWAAQVSRYGRVYAFRDLYLGGGRKGQKSKRFYLHRVLFGDPPGVEIDHRDGDSLNNRRYNLRPASNQQNARNGKKHVGATSRWRGVSWRPERSRWEAQIQNTSGMKNHLGLFKSELDAADAYDGAARKAHGEFANLNFP